MTQPLDGVSVVVTRARHQAEVLVSALRQAGGVPIEFPVIDIVEPEDGGTALRSAFAGLGGYDWLIVTSANTVERIAPMIAGSAPKVAAVGPGTADALSELGIAIDIVPPTYVAESLLQSFPPGPGRVLLPQAQNAREVLSAGLRAKGWIVDVVSAYRTVPAVFDTALLGTVREADVVTFTSSSTVAAYLKTGAAVPPLVACIGPITAKTAEANGINVDVIAVDHTVRGLVEALIIRYSGS